MLDGNKRVATIASIALAQNLFVRMGTEVRKFIYRILQWAFRCDREWRSTRHRRVSSWCCRRSSCTRTRGCGSRSGGAAARWSPRPACGTSPGSTRPAWSGTDPQWGSPPAPGDSLSNRMERKWREKEIKEHVRSRPIHMCPELSKWNAIETHVQFETNFNSGVNRPNSHGRGGDHRDHVDTNTDNW